MTLGNLRSQIRKAKMNRGNDEHGFRLNFSGHSQQQRKTNHLLNADIENFINDPALARMIFGTSTDDSFEGSFSESSNQYEGTGDIKLIEDKGDDESSQIEVRSPRFLEYVRTVALVCFALFAGAAIYFSKEIATRFSSIAFNIYFFIVAGTIAVVTGLLLAFNWYLYHRQLSVLTAAKRSSAIVSSLFPETVRDRLYNEIERRKSNDKGSEGFVEKRSSIPDPKAFFDQAPNEESDTPIAEYYTETTIMFLDIAGFTAWSSEREPRQVFHLLETVYASFDELAKKYGVFKIETIGDCYLAVCGLPEPNDEHAIVMVRFATECIRRFKRVTRSLEVELGPSTSELGARVGLHSGPVTAGVLRGQKARFQLFGDTVNVASRMESTGLKGMIHVSQTTADVLIEGGKPQWVFKRKDLVEAKGKGCMQTYFVELSRKRDLLGQSMSSLNRSVSDIMSEASDTDFTKTSSEDPRSFHNSSRDTRLIEWNVEILYKYLKRIVALRDRGGFRPRLPRAGSSVMSMSEDESRLLNSRGTILSEVTDAFEMPRFDGRASQRLNDIDSIDLDPKIHRQLKQYVECIASMYRNNSFHSFEHASHVMMSTSKLLNRILGPDGIDQRGNAIDIARQIHTRTYGISSDPLMHFTAVFAALIHDVDHTGMSNAELVVRRTPASIIYKSRCVAEQNSIDLAWTLLMSEDYTDLRNVIYTNKNELRRFRQMLVNAVVATDIADPELQASQKIRWEKAFEDDSKEILGRNSARDGRTERKATLVFEYLIQASDVAHTMQHWNTFTKWNERLFCERYEAFKSGLGDNPSVNWYRSELAFFDHYIIPLTDKLRQCGVFGVSSDEFLVWSKENRRLFESQGEELVHRMSEKIVSQQKKARRASLANLPNIL